MNMSDQLIVACPTCQTPVIWQAESVYRPFCSERCRLIDLGEWADGSRAIALVENNDGFDDGFEGDY